MASDKPEINVKHEFVEFTPEFSDMQEHTLYISKEHGIAIHKCLCGCGSQVVTPIKPVSKDGWELREEGESVSLIPSIGRWQLPCQSHYFITKSKVIWA